MSMNASTPSDDVPLEFDAEIVKSYVESPEGKGCLRGAWAHDKSVSSAYWDPHGRRIVSTSYDDSIRCELALSCLWNNV